MLIDTINKSRILFIVNPVSGSMKQKGIERLLSERIDKDRFDYRVVYTEGPGHATELSRMAAEEGMDFVVAVGGDGTVNETAAGVVGTETAMGIIPTGSGNGLSRHLRISMKVKRAIDIINQAKTIKIDTATLNDQLFVNVAGVGFDAHVAKKFSKAGKRGFSTYFKVTANAYRDYKPRKYTLTIDGKVIKRRALLVSFANSSQFGNNTSIDPNASLDDGFIDVCIVGKIPFWKTGFLAPLLFIRKFDQTRYVEIIRAKEVQLIRKKGKSIHLDGDPKKMGKELTMKINPLSLRVVVP
ncbi:MAG: diacylglycerol kinase family lipid kinase [Bacteroidales bacterium]|jgi:YegS/Rv2252/BmrU family lipid kinase|nr:diacylglycerol kinase family lipid kinase [Bacteroidales bacterium]